MALARVELGGVNAATAAAGGVLQGGQMTSGGG